MIKHYGRYLLIVVILILTGCSHKHPPYSFPTKKLQQFRIATYNINWGEGWGINSWPITKPMESINALKKINADVVLFQEFTPYWQHKMDKFLAKKYPYRAYRHYRMAGGLAILAKYPFITVLYHHPHIGWHPGWIVLVYTPSGVIQVANMHLNPPLVSEESMGFLLRAFWTSKPIRWKEIQYFYSHLNPNLPTIIAGDFNEGDWDSAGSFLKKQSFSDALKILPSFYYTWKWEHPFITFADRLDHIFYSPDITVVRAQVVYEGDSDHFPSFADFILPSAH